MDLKGYEIIREISRGPISTVYLGTQLSLKRPVLIKRLNSQWMNESDLMERFRREALICARLKHRNIVDIIDVATHPQNLYLVIEFIDGVDLHQLIRRYHPLPFPIIEFISKELLQGLAYAHQQGVIHRDIKPANIMIGKDGSVKIADFGLARTEDLPAISTHGEAVGTPAYMSPEQARVSTVEFRSDLFSAGVTFYELCTGISPFKGNNIVESIQKLLTHTPPPVTTLNPDIPQWYAELVQQLMAKNPANRPASADEILADEHFRSIPDRRKELAALVHQSGKESFDVPRSASPSTSHSHKATTATVKRRRALPLLGILAMLFAVVFFFLPGQFSQSSPTENAAIADSTTKAVLTNLTQPPDTTIGLPLAQAQETTSKDGTRHPKANLPKRVENNLQPQPISENIADNESQLSTPEKLATETVLQTGKLAVQCTPWAEVWVDGQSIDTTPLHKPIELSPGRHQIELRNPEFPPYVETVEIAAGETRQLTVNLRQLVGYLDLKVVPWAKIFLNNRYIETTPLPKPLPLSPGTYLLRLENPAFPAKIDTVVIAAGQIVNKRITLK